MREIINKINTIEREIARRAKSPLSRYNKTKVHHKQMQFHKCTDRSNRWVFGGNRSGKTECGAVETVWLARGIHPYRDNKDDISCWVVSLSQQVQRDVAQSKILHYIDSSWIREISMIQGRKSSPQYGIIDYIVIDNVFGGTSRIAFKSCEAGREKFQGTSVDFVWFDEEPPLDIYQECLMRVIDRNGHVFGTMTPLKGATWVYDTIYINASSNSEVWYIFMEWADNPYLPKRQVELMTATLASDQLDSRRYGKFGINSGLVYGDFDVNVHVIEPFVVPSHWQDKLSIDPGLNNPLSCHWYCVDDDGVVYVVAEHYLAGRDVSYHASVIRDISSSIGWHTDSQGRIEALIDSAANQRTLSSPASVSQLFAENGILVNSRVNKDVYSGINIVKQYLSPIEGAPRLYIFSNCTHMIAEFKKYMWGNSDSPRKVDDHAMDELRYYLCSRPASHMQSQLKSIITRDKEKLYRHNRRRM